MSYSIRVEPRFITTNRLTPEFYAQEYLAFDMKLGEIARRFDQAPLGELGRLFTGPFGSTLPTSVFIEEGVPLLRVQNVDDLDISSDNLAKISPALHQEIARSQLRSGDLAIAKAGRIGTTAVIPEWIPQCNITQHIVGVRVNRRKVDSYYLAAMLASRYGQLQLGRQGVGTLLKYLGVEDTRDIKVVLPPRPIQEYIGAKVRLAERCRLLARENLWQAQELLTERLDLDAFSPSTERFSYVSATRMTNRMAAEFYLPAYQDLDQHLAQVKVPNAHLGDLRCQILRTTTPERIAIEAIPCILTSDIEPQSIKATNPSLWIDQTIFDNHPVKLKRLDVVYTSVGPPVGEAALVLPEYLPMAVGGDVSVLRASDALHPGYLCLYLNSKLGQMQNERFARGIRQRRVYPEDIREFQVPILHKNDQAYIGERVIAFERLNDRATWLVREAKADVEALIEGRLDVDGIMAGRVRPPTWEELEV